MNNENADKPVSGGFMAQPKEFAGELAAIKAFGDALEVSKKTDAKPIDAHLRDILANQGTQSRYARGVGLVTAYARNKANDIALASSHSAKAEVAHSMLKDLIAGFDDITQPDVALILENLIFSLAATADQGVEASRYQATVMPHETRIGQLLSTLIASDPSGYAHLTTANGGKASALEQAEMLISAMLQAQKKQPDNSWWERIMRGPR